MCLLFISFIFYFILFTLYFHYLYLFVHVFYPDLWRLGICFLNTISLHSPLGLCLFICLYIYNCMPIYCLFTVCFPNCFTDCFTFRPFYRLSVCLSTFLILFLISELFKPYFESSGLSLQLSHPSFRHHILNNRVSYEFVALEIHCHLQRCPPSPLFRSACHKKLRLVSIFLIARFQ